MKVYLLFEDREYDAKPAAMNKNEIIQDFNLDIIFKFMSRNDKYIYKTVRSVMMNPLSDKDGVLYRQEILKDCVLHYEEYNKIYEMASQTVEKIEQFTDSTKKVTSQSVSNVVNVLHSLELLGILTENMDKLRQYIASVEEKFASVGMKRFCESFALEYDSEFAERIKPSIEEMNFIISGGEITYSGCVGQGLKTKDIIINGLVREEAKRRKKRGVFEQLYYKLFMQNVILLEDAKLEEEVRSLEAAGLVHILKLYQSFIRELTAFFETLQAQMAFYIGGANLVVRLKQMHIHTCMPRIADQGEEIFEFQGLYDLSLALYNRSRPVSNGLSVKDGKLIIITGANQGGKSTYLRSIGIAQILLQCGMPVPADSYCSGLYGGIFSHFTRREDTAMNSGKLDEELARMNRILMSVTPDSLVLLNESFATTTEREGSKIAHDVVKALYENGTRVIMVTHLYEFTRTFYGMMLPGSLFLSAERLTDGTRTFRIYEREPERTSYGLDLYDEIIVEKPSL